jgi:hypothetical protein
LKLDEKRKGDTILVPPRKDTNKKQQYDTPNDFYQSRVLEETLVVQALLEQTNRYTGGPGTLYKALRPSA